MKRNLTAVNPEALNALLKHMREEDEYMDNAQRDEEDMQRIDTIEQYNEQQRELFEYQNQ